MTLKNLFSISLIKAISLFLIFGSSSLAAESERPIRWATPIQMPGVGNFYKITDYLYRSEQPTEEGMKNLKKMGIKTLINLRVFHSDLSRIKKTGLLYEEVNIRPWHIEDEDVIRILRIFQKRENGPFLMHCWRGADRLGLIAALFRIVKQGWTKDEAIEEMVKGGYGFHPVWRNIMEYVQNVDVKRIRKEVEKGSVAHLEEMLLQGVRYLPSHNSNYLTQAGEAAFSGVIGERVLSRFNLLYYSFVLI